MSIVFFVVEKERICGSLTFTQHHEDKPKGLKKDRGWERKGKGKKKVEISSCLVFWSVTLK
jgi:hypothetical protein